MRNPRLPYCCSQKLNGLCPGNKSQRPCIITRAAINNPPVISKNITCIEYQRQTWTDWRHQGVAVFIFFSFFKQKFRWNFITLSHEEEKTDEWRIRTARAVLPWRKKWNEAHERAKWSLASLSQRHLYFFIPAGSSSCPRPLFRSWKKGLLNLSKKCSVSVETEKEKKGKIQGEKGKKRNQSTRMGNAS